MEVTVNVISRVIPRIKRCFPLPCLTTAPGSVGMMFTWGADFMWAEGDKRDKHHGCLGLGDDVEGRLVPTRVHGDMDKHGVVQVRLDPVYWQRVLRHAGGRDVVC